MSDGCEGCEGCDGCEGTNAKSSAAVASRLAEEGTAVEVCSLAQVSDGCDGCEGCEGANAQQQCCRDQEPDRRGRSRGESRMGELNWD